MVRLTPVYRRDRDLFAILRFTITMNAGLINSPESGPIVVVARIMFWAPQAVHSNKFRSEYWGCVDVYFDHRLGVLTFLMRRLPAEFARLNVVFWTLVAGVIVVFPFG